VWRDHFSKLEKCRAIIFRSWSSAGEVFGRRRCWESVAGQFLNEWYEDSQTSLASGAKASNPDTLRRIGLEYTAYGELYLDLLWGTTDGFERDALWDALWDAFWECDKASNTTMDAAGVCAGPEGEPCGKFNKNRAYSGIESKITVPVAFLLIYCPLALSLHPFSRLNCMYSIDYHCPT
jgi:hypothetical protein